MHQALYRTYRPASFDDVVGQRAITQTLRRQVAEDRLSHAYLFTGTRGTGKTTCARILAKAINCQHPIDGNPCNACPSCLGIDNGSVTDVLEIDAASNSGVDNIRSLRDDAIYAPAEVRRRVYIIDEVHMLSAAAFNALLKIIEEPPEHLMFILATTELNKVPATILSRCQRFSFRRLQVEDIEGRLKYVALQEHIPLTDGAARLLAQLADGGMRDALSLLDQCSASGGTLDIDQVYATLGLAGAQKSTAILHAVAEHDTAAALQLLSDLYSAGKDLAALLSELTDLTRDLLVRRSIPGGTSLLSGRFAEAETSALAERFTAPELLYLTNLLQQTSSGFAKSANRRIDAELCLLRMCDPALSLDTAALDARISRLEQQIQSGVPAATAAVVNPVPAPQVCARNEPPPREEGSPPCDAAPVENAPVGFWPDLLNAIRPELKPSVRGFFALKGPVSCHLSGDNVVLVCQNETIRRLVDNPGVGNLIANRAAALLGRQVIVSFKVSDGSGCDGMNQILSNAKGLNNITIK